MGISLQLQNKIINGCFEYWQRGTSFASIANNQYHTDRFHYVKSGAVVHTVSRSTDVPSSAFGTASLQAAVTTVDTSIAASEYVGILQHIEGNVLRSFKNKRMVLTFWVKAFKPGTYCIALRNGNSTLSYVMEYTISASNTWEKKTLRFQHNSTGTWNYDTSIGMTVVWTLAAGSNFYTTANAWNSGNFLSTSNQTNGVDSTSNTFLLSDVCLVEDNDGATRTPDFQLAGRDLAEEFQLCQRYYETVQGWTGNASSASLIEIGGPMRNKRAAPNFSAAGPISVRSNTGSADFTASSPVLANFAVAPLFPFSGFWGQISGFSGLLVNGIVVERQQNNNLRADAEL